MTGEPDGERDLRAGMQMVRRVERRAVPHLPVLNTPLHSSGRLAWRDQAVGLAALGRAGQDPGHPPGRESGRGPGPGPAADGLRASAVVVGRLRQRRLRGRAFYPAPAPETGTGTGAGSTLVVQQRGWSRRELGRPTLLRAAAVQRRWHGLELPGVRVPGVLGAGSDLRHVWVHEELHDGAIITRPQWRETAPEFARKLLQAHVRLGLATQPVAGLATGAVPGSLRELGSHAPAGVGHALEAAGLDLVAAEASLRRLLDRGGYVITAPCHGDPVLGNVLRTPDGSLALLDWELAGQRPVVHDLLKSLWGTADPVTALLALRDDLPGATGGSAAVLPLPLQAALVLAVALSRWQQSWEVAACSGRTAQLSRRVQDQALTMCRLLEA